MFAYTSWFTRYSLDSTRLGTDWWTGKTGGRTGIFPSNYAEVLHHPLPTWSTAPPPVTAATARPAKHESAPKYMPMPYKAVHHPETAPNPTGTRPQSQEQQQETDDVKKSKYSHLKNTVSAWIPHSFPAVRMLIALQ
jgi:LAS seventeen-binding protein 1/2